MPPLAEEDLGCCGVWLGMCLDERVAGMGKDVASVGCDGKGASSYADYTKEQ